MDLSKIFLAFGIAVVFAAFVIYGLNVVYEPPKYDYSQNDCYLKYDCYKPVRDCEDKYYNDSNFRQIEMPKEAQECSINITQTGEYKQCMELSDKCNEEFQKKSPQYAYAKNTFIILLILGIASIIAGSRMFNFEGISAGLIGGGVILILWSLLNSWMYLYHLDQYLKVAGLGVALAVLVFIAYNKLDKPAGNSKNQKKRRCIPALR